MLRAAVERRFEIIGEALSKPFHGRFSGGVRVIYYHVAAQAQIRMILMYRKGIKDDLTPRE